MTIEERIQRLEDIEAIRSLRHKFHYFVNERLPERAREIYTDDAVIIFDEFLRQEGIEAIIAAASRFPEDLLLRQYIHNHEIELDGDTATAYSYLDARYGQNGQSLIVSGRYDDKYRRTPDGWRICEVKVTLQFSVPIQKGWGVPADQLIEKENWRNLTDNMKAGG